jgi:hypothetical protein
MMLPVKFIDEVMALYPRARRPTIEKFIKLAYLPIIPVKMWAMGWGECGGRTKNSSS